MALLATEAALRRTAAARNRADAERARSDTRAWVVSRRERTRRLIELGGLVEKSGLAALLGGDDPDAVLLGALLSLRAPLLGDGLTVPEPVAVRSQLALWRRRGQRAFRADVRDGADDDLPAAGAL